MERDLDPYDQPTAPTGGAVDPYAHIRDLYAQITGGKYTPSDADLQQFGTNIDADYEQKIRQQIGQWWTQYQAQQPAAKATETGDTTTPDPTQPPDGLDPGTGGDAGGPPNPYDSGGLVPTDGTYPGGPPPKYDGGQPYDYHAFTPTTAADLLADPGYDVRFNRGLDAVRADKAASGVLNGGGTARALLDYGQDSASQEFKNVDDRRLNAFNVNEDNRFRSYTSGVNNSQFAQNSQYNDWLSSYNAWRNSRNDAFDQKFKLATF